MYCYGIGILNMQGIGNKRGGYTWGIICKYGMICFTRYLIVIKILQISLLKAKRNTNSHNITYSAGIIEDGGRV